MKITNIPDEVDRTVLCTQGSVTSGECHCSTIDICSAQGVDIILALNPAGMMTIHGVLQCFSVDLCYLLECIAK